MQLQDLSFESFTIPLPEGLKRQGILIKMTRSDGALSWGETSPFPRLNEESFEQCWEQLQNNRLFFLNTTWTATDYGQKLRGLYPSVAFGMESALLDLLNPISNVKTHTSALLMGSPSDILKLADEREKDGLKTAKLKVSHLNFADAKSLIAKLKGRFRLRIDVNRAWTKEQSLAFFDHFPLDTFDYVEEPFQNPQELEAFPHPLAVDESFPKDLSLEELERLPTLKALIYKPTVQGGLYRCLPLVAWTKQRGIQLILGSAFESQIGIDHIAAMAHRLGLKDPMGLGTSHYLKEQTLP